MTQDKDIKEKDILDILSELAFHVADLSLRINDIESKCKNIDHFSKEKRGRKPKFADESYININDPITSYIVKMSGICPCCRIRRAVSNHHIIPRSNGGEDTIRNKINLCKICHDYVELKTDAYIKSGLNYSIDLLKMMIVNDAFCVNDKEVK